ncbi:MAG: methyltransferase domain-containing protein [Actinomycetota bacterium]|nr:methyltransferase domain-containing protein [Actinomycetota bacterium]
MTPTPEQVVRLWDALAGSYDQVGVDFITPIASGLVDELDPHAGERAVDLGCGRGAALLPIARRVGPSGAVLGGDISPGMLKACRALAESEGLDRVSLVVLDAQAPDPGAVDGWVGHADLVASSLVLFFLPDPTTALRRWVELLRPGGRLGVATFGGRDPSWVELDEVFAPYLPPDLLDARTSGAAGPFGSDAGVESLLRSVDLVDVRTASRRVTVRFADPEHWYRFSMSLGQRAFWSVIPEDLRPDVKAQAFERLRAVAAPDGSITLWQDARYTLGRRP